MAEFIAMNFNLPTIIGSIIVFGGTGLILWHSHKHGGSGCSGCSGGCNSCGGSCNGNCSGCH